MFWSQLTLTIGYSPSSLFLFGLNIQEIKHARYFQGNKIVTTETLSSVALLGSFRNETIVLRDDPVLYQVNKITHVFMEGF